MKTKLLLIDDEVITLRMTKLLLDQHDFDVESCLTTTEAISVLTTTDIDLILLDISMPTIDGFDFIKLMSSLRIEVPVVFLSNQDDDYTRDRAAAEGVKRCVSKSHELSNLPSIIREVLQNA
jgi:CheY-like chemotaxis protein